MKASGKNLQIELKNKEVGDARENVSPKQSSMQTLKTDITANENPGKEPRAQNPKALP